MNTYELVELVYNTKERDVKYTRHVIRSNGKTLTTNDISDIKKLPEPLSERIVATYQSKQKAIKARKSYQRLLTVGELRDYHRQANTSSEDTEQAIANHRKRPRVMCPVNLKPIRCRDIGTLSAFDMVAEDTKLLTKTASSNGQRLLGKKALKTSNLQKRVLARTIAQALFYGGRSARRYFAKVSEHLSSGANADINNMVAEIRRALMSNIVSAKMLLAWRFSKWLVATRDDVFALTNRVGSSRRLKGKLPSTWEGWHLARLE